MEAIIIFLLLNVLMFLCYRMPLAVKKNKKNRTPLVGVVNEGSHVTMLASNKVNKKCDLNKEKHVSHFSPVSQD